jgi:hypothetical protein
MNAPMPICFCWATLLAAIPAQAQGAFQNLDFESANIPASTPVGSFVAISQALVGWSAYFTSGTVTDPQTQVGYDDIK